MRLLFTIRPSYRHLPEDVLIEVLRSLDVVDVLKLRRVSTAFTTRSPTGGFSCLVLQSPGEQAI